MNGDSHKETWIRRLFARIMNGGSPEKAWTRRLFARHEGHEFFARFQSSEKAFLLAFELDGQVFSVKACRFNGTDAWNLVKGKSIVLEPRDDLARELLKGDLDLPLTGSSPLLNAKVYLYCGRYLAGMGEHETCELQIQFNQSAGEVEVDYLWRS